MPAEMRSGNAPVSRSGVADFLLKFEPTLWIALLGTPNAQQLPNRRYAQILAGHGRARVEVSSNVYLSGIFALTEAEHDQLGAFGFTPPTRTEDPDAGSDASVDNPPANWTRSFAGRDWRQAALMT